jgi:hypothetical protein
LVSGTGQERPNGLRQGDRRSNSLSIEIVELDKNMLKAVVSKDLHLSKVMSG